MLNRIRQYVLADESDLLKLLANTYHEVTGEIIEPEDAITNKRPSLIPDFELEQASLMIPKTNNSKLTLIVIEAIDYYLYETSFGFDRMAAITRGIGCLLSKLARMYSIPCLVTATVNQPKDYSKYNLSPWMNFTGDSIFVLKSYVKPIDGIEKKPIIKPLIYSMKAPFCTDKTEGPKQEYKVKFKLSAVSLQQCGDSLQPESFFTERTYKKA